MGTEGGTLVIDANSRVLCPGSIDMHAHSNLTHPSRIPKLTQGIGQDGIAHALVTDATLPNGNPAHPPFWDQQHNWLDLEVGERSVTFIFLYPHKRRISHSPGQSTNDHRWK